MIFIVGISLLFGVIISKMLTKVVPLISHIPVVGGILEYLSGTWYLIPIAVFLIMFGLTRKLLFSVIVTAIIAVLAYLTGGFV